MLANYRYRQQNNENKKINILKLPIVWYTRYKGCGYVRNGLLE
jgi:hypothetical protein